MSEHKTGRAGGRYTGPNRCRKTKGGESGFLTIAHLTEDDQLGTVTIRWVNAHETVVHEAAGLVTVFLAPTVWSEEEVVLATYQAWLDKSRDL